MRIAIDPADLRSAASRLRSEADHFESLAGQLGGVGLPDMPPAERAAVTGKLRAAASALRRQGRTADALATALDRRAAMAIIAALGGGLAGFASVLFSSKAASVKKSGILALLLRMFTGGDTKDFFSSGPYRDGKSFWQNKGKLGTSSRFNPGDVFFKQEGFLRRRYGDYKHWPDDPERMFGGVGMSKRFKLLDEKVWGKSGDHYDVAVLAAEAEAKGGVKWTGDNVEASAEAALAAYLFRASVGFKGKHVQAQAGASAGANAKANLGAAFGKDGVRAKAGAEAFVGGEAHAGGGLSAAGVTTKAQAGVSYGLGAKATGEADIGLDKVKFKAQIGATLGLGVNFGVDVEVKPMETVKSVGSGIKSVASKIPGPW